MKIGNKYLGISATRGTVLFTHVYLFGWDFLIYRDGDPTPFMFRYNNENRLWWNDLVILWERI